jgi:TusE/DsrC/DsvC family sulfur relay protein
MSEHTLRVYDSVLGLLSNEDNPTPMVRLNRVVPFKQTKVFAKLEWYNPFGAVKDRIADNLLRDAEQRGILDDIEKLVEPTSGNTGLALAMMANAKGYRLTTPLSEAIPLEKRTVLRFFGSDVIELDDTLCPAPGAPEGAIAKAIEISERPDFHMLNQYENEANPGAHYRTTGPEIWKQTQGKVTHFLREYYDEYQIAPAVRILTKGIAKKLGREKGNTKFLYQLFPRGPAKQACRYAGLPKPTGCI